NPPPGLTTNTVAPPHQRVSANRRSVSGWFSPKFESSSLQQWLLDALGNRAGWLLLLRRLYSCGCQNERRARLIGGHERALRWFGGVTLSYLFDNPRTLVLGRCDNKVLWHPGRRRYECADCRPGSRHHPSAMQGVALPTVAAQCAQLAEQAVRKRRTHLG